MFCTVFILLSRHGLLLSLQISLVVSEMLPHLEDVLFVGHSGVVVKLAEAGLRSAGQQQEIVEALLSAFHAESDRKCCVPLFLALTAYEVYSEHEEKMESDKDIARVRHYHLHLIYSTCIWNILHTVRVRVYGILYIQYVYTCIWNILYVQYVYVYMEYSTVLFVFLEAYSHSRVADGASFAEIREPEGCGR